MNELQVQLRPVSALIPYAKNARTHSDEQVWDVVAFLKKMPDLDPAGYDAAVKSSQAQNPK